MTEKTNTCPREARPLPFIIEGKVEVPVNHNQPFDKARDASNQDYTDSNIQLDRIIDGVDYEQKDLKETISVEIAHFGKDIRSQAADCVIYAAGYRHATLAEVFAFACTQEGKLFQKKFCVVSLATEFRDVFGLPLVIGLDVSDDKRRLSLHSYFGEWSDCYRFLVVRK